MRVCVVIVLFVGCIVMIDAANPLPNGGGILSPDGKYISGDFDTFFFKQIVLRKLINFNFFTGIIPQIFGPLFKCLKKNIDKCGRGFVQIMLNLLTDSDNIFKCNDTMSLRLLLKIFGNLYQSQLPHIHDKKIHDVFAETVEKIDEQEAGITSGCMNLNQMNQINALFVKVSNILNDRLKGCQCDDNDVTICNLVAK